MREEGPEEFLAPLVRPTLPARFYFRYGRGVEVSRDDSRDHLEMVYQQVRPGLCARVPCLGWSKWSTLFAAPCQHVACQCPPFPHGPRAQLQAWAACSAHAHLCGAAWHAAQPSAAALSQAAACCAGMR